MIQKRPVIEISAERNEDDNRAVFDADRRLHQIEELLAFAFDLNLREDFLELVDHQNQLAVFVRQGPSDPFGQARGLFAEQINHARQGRGGNAQQGRRQFFQGVFAWHHLGVKPVFRTFNPSLSQGRQHASFDQAGLSAAAGANHRQEIVLDDRLLQTIQHLFDHSRTSEEIIGVGLLEGAQTLVGVLGFNQVKGGQIQFGQRKLHS